jgi:hypothetical protein
MSAPFNDIGTNPPTSDRRSFKGCVATVSGIKYGHVVIFDTGTTNFRDTKLPAGAAATLLKGVVSDQGDPNSSGAFAVGDEFACCDGGEVEVLLDAGATAVTKGQPVISSATAGTVKGWTNETAVDVLGEFTQDYDNSLGSSAVLVSMRVGIYRKT